MKHLLQLLPLCLLLLTLPGCSDEEAGRDNIVSGQEVRFTLHVPGSGTVGIDSRAMIDGSGDAEVKINSLDILVFRQSGAQEVFEDKIAIDPSTITAGSPRTFQTKVKLFSDPTRYVLIANARTETALLSPAGQLKEDVMENLIHSNAGKWNATSSTSFDAIPMWGETNPQTILGGETLSGIYMHRMVARIDVEVLTAAQPTFQLQEVYIYNQNQRGRIVPDVANWNAALNNGTATAATLPPDPSADLTVQKPTWHYGSADGISATQMKAILYTFEAKADKTDPLKETCIIIGGSYNSGATSYYRVDIQDKVTNPSTPVNKDILRNHLYTIQIQSVSNAGADTPDQAFEGGFSLKAEVLDYNMANQSVNLDQQYKLEVSKGVHFLDYLTRTATFDVGTDNAGGVVCGPITYISGSRNWLTINETSNAGSSTLPYKKQINLNVTSSTPSGPSAAEFYLSSGNMNYKIQVTCEGGWARSNIVWDGSKLTFATTPAENAIIPANSQGVLFQWGSLVAISPATLASQASGTQTYVAGRASTGAGHIVYDPTNNYAYAWASIPYINSTAAPFNNNTATEDDFATYNGGQGWDNTGKGDICRYISSQGWVSGNWRLPTADEYDQLLAELPNGVSNGGGFSNINVSPAGGTNHYGYYQPLSGRWLGSGATTSSGVGSPTVGAYFPAGGYRYTNGTALIVGNGGLYWSGSSASTADGYYLYVGSASANRTTGYRQAALPVRCVRE